MTLPANASGTLMYSCCKREHLENKNLRLVDVLPCLEEPLYIGIKLVRLDIVYAIMLMFSELS